MVSKALCKCIPITFSGQWYSLPDDSGRCHYACRKHLLMHIFEKVNEWKVAEWREERGYINGAVAPTRPTVESLTVTLDHSGCVLHRGTGQREPFCSLGLWLSRGLPLFLIHPKASNELAAAPRTPCFAAKNTQKTDWEWAELSPRLDSATTLEWLFSSLAPYNVGERVVFHKFYLVAAKPCPLDETVLRSQ